MFFRSSPSEARQALRIQAADSADMTGCSSLRQAGQLADRGKVMRGVCCFKVQFSERAIGSLYAYASKHSVDPWPWSVGQCI